MPYKSSSFKATNFVIQFHLFLACPLLVLIPSLFSLVFTNLFYSVQSQFRRTGSLPFFVFQSVAQFWAIIYSDPCYNFSVSLQQSIFQLIYLSLIHIWCKISPLDEAKTAFNLSFLISGPHYLVPASLKMAAVGAAETSGVSENLNI